MQCDEVVARMGTEPSDCCVVIEHEHVVIVATTFLIGRVAMFENVLGGGLVVLPSRITAAE
jgi:hypothetical protein